MAKKKRTTIRVDQAAWDAVVKSGVRNISEYTQNLWLADLKRQKEVSKKEANALDKINEKLDVLHEDWKKLKEQLPRGY